MNGLQIFLKIICLALSHYKTHPIGFTISNKMINNLRTRIDKQ